MKKIILMMLLCTLVFTACSVNNADVSIDNVNSEQNVETAMTPFREKILSTDEKVNELFSTEVENTVISHIGNVEVCKYVGPNSTFEEVCNQLQDYCTPNVAEKLIRKIGYINVDGAIGFILATGEVSFSEFEEKDMEIISIEGNDTIAKVTKYTVGGDYSRDYTYSFKTEEDGNLIITDIIEEQ